MSTEIRSSHSASIPADYQRRRKRKRRKRPSKAARYFVAILTIVLMFFIAFSIGSWIIGNFYDSQEKENPEETILTLQGKLDGLTTRNNELMQEISELKSQLEKYNERYGPLDAPIEALSIPVVGEDEAGTEEPSGETPTE